MIARLRGAVIDLEERGLIVDVAGLGYRVAVLGSLLATVKKDTKVILHIYHQVTDSLEALYGFATKEDLQYFKLLLTVPSVGARTAMRILDAAPPKTLAQAVAEKDVKILTKVSGVGKKTADRILVELQGKMKDVKITGPSGDVQTETVSALINLGFTKEQARQLIDKLPKKVSTVEEAVKHALKGE
jgi:holliday junction DNA helicase RuvA